MGTGLAFYLAVSAQTPLRFAETIRQEKLVDGN
jgi:hypothetical protein